MKINLPKFNYNKIVHHLTISVDLLFVAFLLISYLGGVAEAWGGFVGYLFYFVVAINTLFFALKIRGVPERERADSKMIYYFSHFFLLTLVIIVINQFLKNAFVIENLGYISAVSVALGFLTFYAYRNKVEKEIEDEGVLEEKREKERKEDFCKVHPKMNSIPILKYLLKWMYVLGWKFSIPFVAIVVLFVAIKIGMPLVYTGSFVDEYWHILSGIEFFKTGHFAELYKGSYYIRGAYVSVLVGFFMYVFGQTIFVAKMLPATIGIINFILLYLIARHIIKRKRYILLLMLIYAFSPWIIFNHFYIRMYVFYELFLLSLTFCFLKVINYWRDKKWRKFSIYSGLFILINLVNYLFSYDNGKYMALILSGLFVLYFYLFETKFNKKLKFIPVIIFSILIWFLMDIQTKINSLFNTNVFFTTPENLKYDWYFFNLNLIFSIFFFMSLTTIKKLKSKEFMIIISFLVIFLIHLLSSQDLQILRGILYFFPAYYLIIIFSVSRLNFKKFSIILICFILAFTIANNYPNDFFNGPNISEEIDYRDWFALSDYIDELITNETIILTVFPQSFRFYNSNKHSQLFVMRDNENSYTIKTIKYLVGKTWIYAPTNDPIICSTEELINLTQNNEDILLLGGNRNLHSMITTESKNEINENYFLLNEFQGVSIYKKLNLNNHSQKNSQFPPVKTK